MNPEVEKDTSATEFILPPELTQGTAEQTGEENTKFPVLPNLVIIGCILFGLFGTIVIPKTLSYLHLEAAPSSPIVPLPDVAAVAESSVDVFADVSVLGEAAFVYDVANDKVLYEKNSNEALPLASITKLMTALVSYELLEDDTTITISAAAAAEQSGGTLQAGEIFPVKRLADFSLISSYNSAAYTLADSVGRLLGEGDPVAQFVAAMNIRADELKLESFTFANPTGLDISATLAGAYGSASDVSHLVAYILETYPEILLPTTKPYTRIYNSNGEYHEANNTNDIVNDIPNLRGSKTGYTDLAGGNLTVVFDAGYNRPIVVTVLGSSHSGRFDDVMKLVEAAHTSLEVQ